MLPKTPGYQPSLSIPTSISPYTLDSQGAGYIIERRHFFCRTAPSFPIPSLLHMCQIQGNLCANQSDGVGGIIVEDEKEKKEKTNPLYIPS